MSAWTLLRDKILPATKNEVKIISKKQDELLTKLIIRSLKQDKYVFRLHDALIYVPNYPEDLLQNHIVNEVEFFEESVLNELNEFIKHDSIILDIGANIGNHTLYWLTKKIAKHIYCFEPRKETFDILKENITLNKIEEKTTIFQLALSEKKSNLSVKKFHSNNIGATEFEINEEGNIKSEALDNLKIENKIDFIKIDVEGMEKYVLNGAKETIKRDKPLIFIEIFSENFNSVNDILEGLDYFIVKEFEHFNYLYKPN